MGTLFYSLRRLHTLSGIIPLGLFLLVHLYINSFIFLGRETYDRAAESLHSVPLSWLLETLLIFLPLVFHGVYGLWKTFTCSLNGLRYGFYRGYAFYFQRLTGLVLFLVLALHIYNLRFAAGGKKLSEIFMSELHNPLMLTLDVILVLAAAYHMTNGIRSFLITWGITSGPKSRRVAEISFLVLFVMGTIMGFVLLGGFY